MSAWTPLDAAAGGVPEPTQKLPLPEPAQKLPLPEHIGPEARMEIRARMGRHADTVSALVRSVILLDRPSIRALASRIADEESIGRATGGPQPKRPPLPRGFVVEQGELSLVARQLAAAAVEGDDAALADRFSALTRTCVSCHSAYLHGRPDVQPLTPKGKSEPARP